MRKKSEILIVDDEADHAEAMAEGLTRSGYNCSVATSEEEGIRLLREKPFDLVVTDLVMPGADGMQVLKAAKEIDEDIQVVFITAYASIENAVQAMEKGAYTFLTKPLNLAELRAKVKKAIQLRSLSREKSELARRVERMYGFENILGQSPPMQKVFEILQQVAPTNATVLLTGESGTGKELAARAIHQNSPRKNRPFVAINCAALSESIIESELFGHEKGAFTGAIATRQGKFEYTDGGTLFLDEIGDMPGSTQVKLVRVIEDGEVTRIGSNRPIKVDVRIISATNTNLEERVKSGSFREDLYYRLRVVTIDLPPLRDRMEDLPLLIEAFLKELSATHKRSIRGLSKRAEEAFYNYSWPGNVRELKNCLESMIVTSRSDVLDIGDIPLYIRAGQLAPVSRQLLSGMSLEEVEKELIKNTLIETGGNREEAASRLGIGERTLYRKIKAYGLS